MDALTPARRLQHDLKELHATPLPNITAVPLNDNLLTWSVNMVAESGVWAGLPLHLHLEFPQDYPASPPDVLLLTKLKHPNVFDWGPNGQQWICLDMIKPPEYYSKPYQGWSSTYTLPAILLQLYGFLVLDESIDQVGTCAGWGYEPGV